MINHARTILLNQDARQTNPADTGYEYVPEDYRAARLPTALATIHGIIFGKNTDNYFRNYRARELLSYVHQTELADYVYQFDPRVTYWPAITDNKIYGVPKKILSQQLIGSPRRLAIGGTFNASNALGRSDYDYTVLFGDSATANNEQTAPTVIVQSVPKLTQIQTTVFNNNSGIRAVSLPDTSLNVRPAVTTGSGRITTELSEILVVEDYSATTLGDILLEETTDIFSGVGGFDVSLAAADPAQENELLSQAPFNAANLPLLRAMADARLTKVRGIWSVAARANPSPAIISVLPNLEFLGEPTYLALFGVGPEEPYKTFQNLWEDHPLPTYRLGGIVLALIYRINELLKAQDG